MSFDDLSEHVRVDVCDVVTSTLVPTQDGATWLVPGSIGGWDSPDMRGTTGEPTGMPGVTQMGVEYGGRLLDVPLECEADTREAAWAAWYRATGRMPGLRRYGTLIVYEDVPKWLRVTQGAKPIIPEPVNGSFEGNLTLLAEYPLKRALDPVTINIPAGATAEFIAEGTEAAEVIVTLKTTGLIDLRAYGARMGTRLSLPSGTVMASLTADGRKRTITAPGGVDRFDAIGYLTQWLAVQPGANEVENHGAEVDLTYYPTYP